MLIKLDIHILALVRNEEHKYDKKCKILLEEFYQNSNVPSLKLPGGDTLFLDDNSIEDNIISYFKNVVDLAIKKDELSLFGVYSSKYRDLETSALGYRSIAIVYYTFIDVDENLKDNFCTMTIEEAAKEGKLAFDHSDIVREYI